MEDKEMKLEKIYNLKGKVFVVTGGSGFVGSNLLKNLSLSGAKVACVDIAKPKSKLKNVHYFYCDIRNA